MTIQLTQSRVVNGSVATSGTQFTLNEATEAYFISMGWATRVGAAPYQGGSSFARFNDTGTALASPGIFPLKTPIATGVELFAAFGDSLTERATAVGSGTAAYDAQGYPSWVQALSRGRLWMPLVVRADASAVLTTITNYCKGVSGDTTVDMLLRTTDITNLNPLPKYVFFLAGTNDVAVTATSNDSALTIFNRWREIVERFRAAGIIVVCVTILPRGNGTSATPWNAGFSAAQVLTARGKIMQVNQYIRAFCAETPGTILVDPWRRLVDWSTTTSDFTVGYTKDGDYLHTNDLGAYIVADECMRAMPWITAAGELSIFDGSGDLYSATDNPYGSMVDGSFVTGTGGTATAPFSAGAGGVPTNWTFNRFAGAGASTATVEKQARADGKGGNECKLVFTGGAGGPDSFRGYPGTSIISSANFTAGDAIYAYCDATVSATGNYAPPSLEIRLHGASVLALRKSQTDVPGNYVVGLRSPLMICGAGIGDVNYWTVDIIGTTCAATVTRRNMSLRKYNPGLPGSVV